MKKNIIYIALVASVAMMLDACSFDRFPQGGSILQQQYEKLDNTLEGSMRGIYALQYTRSGSNHAWFAKRSIDMYEDMMCGDMALTAYNYGWFQQDANGLGTINHNGTIWSHYYLMLHNVNAVIRLVHSQCPTLLEKINNQGLSDKTIYTDHEIEVASFYAQALTMRGYAYSELVRFFLPETKDLNSKGKLLSQWTSALPVYTENNMDDPQPTSSALVVYEQIASDLSLAVTLFNAFDGEDAFKRAAGTKLPVTGDIAAAILAYNYLNKGNSQDDYQHALDYAEMVIEKANYKILPNDQLTSTGFNNISNVDWMWARKTTVETVTGLPSFWGQVDIHSYSYAWIGDTKAIDENLQKQMPSWDGRKKWFNDGKANDMYLGCPDGKFYSAVNRYSTKADDLDREWLNDDVYMRIEMVYLVAAEAAYRVGDMGKATHYLNELTDQRLDLESATVATDYAAYQATLSDPAKLLAAINYNWRVELWGEGYGWQTFRRLTKQFRLGGNHSLRAGEEITSSSDAYIYFPMPSSEATYNPNIEN